MTPTQYEIVELFEDSEKQKLMDQMKQYSTFDLKWIISVATTEKRKILDMSYNENENVISLTMAANEGSEEPKQMSLILSKK